MFSTIIQTLLKDLEVVREMSEGFYTFVGTNGGEREAAAAAPSATSHPSVDEVLYEARIAVYDDPTVAPRVVVIEPKPVRDYLEEITLTTNTLSHEQGGTIPFMIIREIVENYIHAYFMSPTISILDGGNTIRFSDQGPGIASKERALQYGTTSATAEMRKYIRGVGSGLPLAQQYMLDKGGSLTIQDNIAGGTVVTISTRKEDDASMPVHPLRPEEKDVPRPSFETPELTDRSKQVLTYLSSHELVGPTDMAAQFGGSQPTWSRELKALEEQGILTKAGQKRHLTEYGRTCLQAVRL